jgi:hypothetical protein
MMDGKSFAELLTRKEWHRANRFDRRYDTQSMQIAFYDLLGQILVVRECAMSRFAALILLCMQYSIGHSAEKEWETGQMHIAIQINTLSILMHWIWL